MLVFYPIWSQYLQEFLDKQEEHAYLHTAGQCFNTGNRVLVKQILDYVANLQGNITQVSCHNLGSVSCMPLPTFRSMLEKIDIKILDDFFSPLTDNDFVALKVREKPIQHKKGR